LTKQRFPNFIKWHPHSSADIPSSLLLNFYVYKQECFNFLIFEIAFRFLLTIFAFISVGFEVIGVATEKSSVFWLVTSCSFWKGPDVSEEHIASVIKVEE
jgi:hypothetical protein